MRENGFLRSDVTSKLFIEMSTVGPATAMALAQLVRSRGAALTRRIVHLGPAGSGYAMKLCANLLMESYLQALAESLALGVRAGLDLTLVLEILQELPVADAWLRTKLPILQGSEGDMSLDAQGSDGGRRRRRRARRRDAERSRRACGALRHGGTWAKASWTLLTMPASSASTW